MPTFLITGANRGIGLEIAKKLCARGDTVLATTRTGSDADLAALGARVLKLEVSDEDSIVALGATLASTPIDVLINNAGVGSQASSIKDQTLDELSRVFTVNAFAPILIAKACLPALRAAQRRVIMNVSSQLASIATNNGGSSYPYRASKTALNQLTACLANELRPEKFCCVSVHPGWVRTDMGGPKAPMLPPESANHLVTLADRLTPAESGRFLNFDGAPMAF